MSERSRQEPARDVLAAEAFAVPAADPWLHPHPITLPEDPTGIPEPHDVLAAEDFAMPAPPASRVSQALSRRPDSIWPIALLAGGLALIALRLMRRR